MIGYMFFDYDAITHLEVTYFIVSPKLVMQDFICKYSYII